ncbi:leucine-rich repeat-containing protein 69 isoform X3 [Amblyraja radiata]|uniref:leucine-rich repeat-containing protein 69 isoform X3 n=1 Tax=Amblyraja radiata TaxID=386614 RepID=UPI0014039445|nr:leucine-rich repeat-containing protein 69 isoform X3 [Amblyraja radiata]
MADSLVLRALRGNARHLDLGGKKLRRVPKAVGRLQALTRLQLRNNLITELPAELQALDNLTDLNLGNNSLEALPEVLKHLTQLKKLHLFGNKLGNLSPSVLEGLGNLVFLNLNDNKLTTLPAEMDRLLELKYLYVNNNQLGSIPNKLCLLQHLCELHLANNNLKLLPHDIGYLTNLKKLSLPRNQIEELPELLELKLDELYYEQNPLLEKNLISSAQQNEVLSLQEITARYIMDEMTSNSINSIFKHYSEVKKILENASKCAVCGKSFLNTWLECVTFVDLTRKIRMTSSARVIPVRAFLCSYSCFNEPGHHYYGIATP